MALLQELDYWKPKMVQKEAVSTTLGDSTVGLPGEISSKSLPFACECACVPSNSAINVV